jgi:N-acetylglucosamine-6-sulfatase
LKFIDTLYRNRLQALLGVDDLVKNVMDTLAETGQLDNTYIFFASDNGFHQGQHRLDSGKDTGFDEDLHIPFIVRGPGVPHGTVEQMTANVDYAPTFAALAGIDIPEQVDGRSLVPLFKGQSVSPWRQALLLEHKESKFESKTRMQDVISGKGLTEPPDPFDVQGKAAKKDGKDKKDNIKTTTFNGLRTLDGYTYIDYITGEHELYDNNADPLQMQNIYDTAPADLKNKLAGWMNALLPLGGENMRQTELNPPQ